MGTGVNSYLSTTSRVLSRSSSQKIGIVVVQKVVVESLVLVFGQDCIVRLETVLLEKGFVAKVYRISIAILCDSID